MFSSLFVCLSLSNFAQKLPNGFVLNNWLNFGGDPDHRLDTGIVFRIRHCWEIRKAVSTDCAARRCTARHALAGIAIATMTSLCHRTTTDSQTDIMILVRRALAEVCTVPVLLVIIIIIIAIKQLCNNKYREWRRNRTLGHHESKVPIFHNVVQRW